MITIEQQIYCVKREIKMRERVYPRLVEQGRMEEEVMVLEIQTMKSVLETLIESDRDDLFSSKKK